MGMPNLKLKPIPNGVMVMVDTTVMLPLLPTLFPKSKPKPSRLPALNMGSNIALMSPKSKRSSLLSKPAMLLQRLTAPQLNTHCPRFSVKLAKPKLLISLPLMLAANKFQIVFLIAIQIYKYKEFFQSKKKKKKKKKKKGFLKTKKKKKKKKKKK